MLRFIFYVVIFFFVYRLLNSFFKPKQTSPNQPAGNNPRQKVTINFDRSKSKSKVAKDVGEYVDFEEIKEEKK